MVSDIKDDIPCNFIRELDCDMIILESADMDEILNPFKSSYEDDAAYYIGVEKICSECGKKIFVRDPGPWTYKRGVKYFCKWSCLTKYDREKREEKEKRRAETLERMRKYRAEKAKKRRMMKKTKGEKK